MVIIGDISFPQESANDVGKRFLELPPLPDFMTLKGPYIKGRKKDGIQVLEIYELEKSKVAEGIEFVTNRCVTYFHKITDALKYWSQKGGRHGHWNFNKTSHKKRGKCKDTFASHNRT